MFILLIITRDIEIKNKLIETRGEVGGDNEWKRGKGLQETCIKDPWTKTKWGRIQGGRWGWVGWGEWWGGKWRQLYLNTNKKREIK